MGWITRIALSSLFFLLTAIFVADKLNGNVTYSWGSVFIPMWFFYGLAAVFLCGPVYNLYAMKGLPWLTPIELTAAYLMLGLIATFNIILVVTLDTGAPAYWVSFIFLYIFLGLLFVYLTVQTIRGCTGYRPRSKTVALRRDRKDSLNSPANHRTHWTVAFSGWLLTAGLAVFAVMLNINLDSVNMLPTLASTLVPLWVALGLSALVWVGMMIWVRPLWFADLVLYWWFTICTTVFLILLPLRLQNVAWTMVSYHAVFAPLYALLGVWFIVSCWVTLTNDDFDDGEDDPDSAFDDVYT